MFSDMYMNDEGPIITKARGTFLATAPLVAMLSLKDEDRGQVSARWDGTNEVESGCHVAFDQQYLEKFREL
jgi:hypothetical protein